MRPQVSPTMRTSTDSVNKGSMALQASDSGALVVFSCEMGKRAFALCDTVKSKSHKNKISHLF
jgi:hypothetical protein